MSHKTRVVVLGGGTAGWMSAAALIRFLGSQADVHLVESEEIGIVGVGEATLPHLRAFISTLGLDEAEFMRETKATFKLGIEFHDFGAIGERYIHPFGDFGVDLHGVGFHHYWLRARALGHDVPIGDYSLPILASNARRFALRFPTISSRGIEPSPYQASTMRITRRYHYSRTVAADSLNLPGRFTA